MASLVLTGGTGTLTWQITGLSSAFNTTSGYAYAGITLYPFTSGTKDFDISTATSYVVAPSSGTNTYTPATTISLPAGTYTFYAFTIIKSGTVYSAGSGTVIVKSAPKYDLYATSDTVTFVVTPGYGYTYYRLFLVDESTETVVLSGYAYYNMTSTFVHVVEGLNPSTTYRANILYSTSTTVIENYSLGIQRITTEASERPENWAWISTIASGRTVSITAAEWNAFCVRINEFREYKGLSAYSFTTVSKGTKISATICNQAWSAIYAISGHGTMPSAAVADGPLYASFFTLLASALNSIT